MKSSVKILVVDSDDAFRGVLTSLLLTLHPDVTPVKTFDEGLNFVRVYHPEVIFADVGTTEVEGLEFVTTVCNEEPSVLMAITSRRSSEELIIASLKAGASDFLRKPFSTSELKDTLFRFFGILSRRHSRILRPHNLEHARIELTIPSSAHALQPVVTSVMQLVTGSCSEREALRLELGVQEILRNAYEHGNLGVNSELKRLEAQLDGFESFLQERCALAVSDSKVIKVIAELSHNRFTCSVEDSGDGFDWHNTDISPLPATSIDPENKDPDISGRGLLLIRRIFDEVSFNSKGNIITVAKDLSDS